MSDAAPSLRARRAAATVADGIILTFDGLLVAVVAAGLLGLATGGTESPLFIYTIGLLQGWLTTPGVGLLELLVYVGIAVVLVGPAWHRYLEDHPELLGLEPDDDGFEYPATAAARERRTRAAGPADGGTTRDRGPPDWLASAFEGATGPDLTSDGSTATGGDTVAGSWTDGGTVGKETGRARTELLVAGLQGTAAAPPADAPSTAPTVDGARQPPAETEGPSPEDVIPAEAERSNRPTRADGPPERPPPRPDDPVGRLRVELAEARAGVSTVARRLAAAADDDTDTETAVAAAVDDADVAVERLRAALASRDADLGAAISAVREDAASLETAIQAAVGRS